MKAKAIIADPPWSYANWSSAKNGAASSAYETFSLPSMKKLAVSDLCDKDAILILWATFPKLEEAIPLANAWGFPEYVTGFPWVKTVPNTGNISTGIGFWTQGASELVLIFRRGKPKIKKGRSRVKGLLVGDVFYAPKGSRHSEKPLGIHEWVESSLEGPYMEIFARKERPGWTCIGGDLGTWLTEGGVKDA